MKRRITKLVWILIASTFVIGVWLFRSAPEKKPQRAFYFWKTRFILDKQDQRRLNELDVDFLYVRFFDVTWDEKADEPRPVGMAKVVEHSLLPARLVPVVFITNQVMARLEGQRVTELADNLVEQIFHMTEAWPGVRIPEIQLDCDWTVTTRDRYFQLLERVRTQLASRDPDLALSATIRLHQIRDRATTGVPPVDRGVLMAYHTSSPVEFAPGNSILDLDLVTAYLAGDESYPLPLDPALPFFGWGIQYDRDGRFVRLLRQISPADVADPDDWVARGERLAEARTDLYLGGFRIMRGDLVELERVEPAVFADLAALLARRTGHAGRVLLFHYDPELIDALTKGQPDFLEASLAVF